MTSSLSPEAVAQMVADREAGTPGPWYIYTNETVRMDMPRIFRHGDAGMSICKTHLIGGRDPDPARANARRIARLPDLETAYLTLAAENATLRAERDDYREAYEDTKRLTRLIDVAMHGEEGAAQQASLCDLVHPAAELSDALVSAQNELATLRASEAAALARMKRLEAALLDAGAMRDAADRVSEWFCTEARQFEGPRIQGLRMAIVAYGRHMQPNPALTPTADKEPKT